MHHHNLFSSNGNNNCVQSEDAGLQAANKCISTSAATEVRCSDVEMRGVGTAPTVTAAAAPAPVLSPRMVGPCPVRPHPRVSSVREQRAAGAIRWPGW